MQEKIVISERNEKLLLNLIDENNRKAQFRTIIALNLEGKQYLFEGICKGGILKHRQGKYGFGYDVISFAQMSMEENGEN